MVIGTLLALTASSTAQEPADAVAAATDLGRPADASEGSPADIGEPAEAGRPTEVDDPAAWVGDAFPGEDAVAAVRTPAMRAVWADAFSSGFKSTTQINNLVSRAVTGRYNTIIAEVLAYQDRTGGGHGAYWNSAIVPKATDITGGIDPLATLCTTAHNNGIQVHAWIVPYRVCTAGNWPPTGNATLQAHPEWFMVPQANMGGGPVAFGSPTAKYVLDPGSPDAQEYLVSIVRELVTNYPIDGINLDYIRYEYTNAGYPASLSYAGSSLARYRDYIGDPNTLPNPTGNGAWDDFRRRTINEFVRRLRVEIPSITSNPRQPVRLSADLICFGNAPSNFEDADAYELFQNWRYWMERGWLDTGIPMNYKREYDGSQATWYRNWVDAAVDWRYDRQMVCGQANYLNRKADSVTQLSYALNTALADGICNYSYAATADENMDDDPEADWTWYSYVATNLFTTTTTVPTMPWRDPNTATEGTLWGRVTDPSDGSPIEFALVQAGGQSFETDGNGYYVVTMLSAAPGGTAYNVTVSKPGCTTVQLNNVVVLPGTVVRRDIFACASVPLIGDMDADGDIDFQDFAYFAFCLHGPGYTYVSGNFCLRGDVDGDTCVDLADLATFQQNYGQ